MTFYEANIEKNIQDVFPKTTREQVLSIGVSHFFIARYVFF